jgi:hypothetical protein
MTEPNPTRIRLNIVSEVALEGGQPRPIHMFRPGTFTDMNGRETSFSQDDVATIVSRFSKRRKLPITERHDFGQAIGRLQDLWSDGDANLFGLPKWNAKGRALLEDETYDGFSCELDHDDHGWVLIGGSLTNYPAVGGLDPVTLAAPPLTEAPTMPAPQEMVVTENITVLSPPVIDKSGTFATAEVARSYSLDSAPSALPPARDDIPTPHLTQGVFPMTEPLEQVSLATPPLPVVADPAVQSQMEAYIRQMEARSAAAQEAAFVQMRADFDRRIRETEQRSQIEQFARAKTVTTTDQPWAVPCTADELTQLLLETPAAVRPRWQTLLNRITASGLVTFDEIGNSGAGGEEIDQWNAIVNAKVAAGQSRVEAIKQTAREHPSLYAAQSLPAKKGGR